mgnify:CR=1 FL=1
MALTDKESWEKIKKSDTKSFESLFCRYHDQLCLYSYGLVTDKDIAEEIVNDVFLKIWTKRNQIHINIGIKPYLFRCVYNACVDFLNQNQIIKQRIDIETDQQINQLAESNEEHIFNLLQSEEVEKDVLNAIEQLPERCKKVFYLSRFELLTYAEISERLNISVNTVKTQISRALESLRERLQKYL